MECEIGDQAGAIAWDETHRRRPLDLLAPAQSARRRHPQRPCIEPGSSEETLGGVGRSNIAQAILGSRHASAVLTATLLGKKSILCGQLPARSPKLLAQLTPNALSIRPNPSYRFVHNGHVDVESVVHVKQPAMSIFYSKLQMRFAISLSLFSICLIAFWSLVLSIALK